MNADCNELNELSRRVIGCAFKVLNTLGAGFLEKIYENALAFELRRAGLKVSQQHGLKVAYEGTVVGEYCVDLLVEEALVVELEVVNALDDAHRLQCINSLKATGLHLCLLLNFARPRLEIKRFVHRL